MTPTPTVNLVSGSDIGIFVVLFYLVLCLISLPIIAFQIWMIIDIVKRHLPEGKEDLKLPWILAILFGGIFGSTIYFFTLRKKLREQEKADGPA